MKHRAEIVERALRIVIERQDEIIDTVVKETGKARTDAMSMEVFSVADQLCYYAKNAEKFLAPRKRKVHGLLGLMKQLRIVYKPLGVVGLNLDFEQAGHRTRGGRDAGDQPLHLESAEGVQWQPLIGGTFSGVDLGPSLAVSTVVAFDVPERFSGEDMFLVWSWGGGRSRFALGEHGHG